MLNILVFSVLAILLSVCISFLPKKVLDPITPIFSLQDAGLRKIRRKRDTTDTFANLFLFLSVVFVLFFWLIPGSSILYGVLLTLSFLCVLAQSNRVTSRMDKVHRSLVLFGVSMMYFFGLFSAVGLFNDFLTFQSVSAFAQDIFSKEAFHLFYILRNHTAMMVALQAILYLIPMYCMWAQFKYMRLENTYKARNIGFFMVKILFICALIVLINYGGIEVLNWAYYINYTEA